MGKAGMSTVAVFKKIDAEKAGLIVVDDVMLHQLQRTLFEMLVELDAFFCKFDIQYSLAGGSALGAVRHGGFIPWDDDVDLLMSRKEYEKLRKVFKAEMGDRYHLQTPENSTRYGLGLARIRKKGTVCRAREDFDSEECGVYIDIFLMENTYDFKPMQYVHGVLSLGFGFALSCRLFYEKRELYTRLACGDEEILKAFRKKIMLGKCFSLISLDAWVHAWNHVNALCKNDSSGYVTVPAGRKHFFKETYKRADVCEMQRCDFTFDGKTVKLSLMKGVKHYLKAMYGDYMKLPNPEDIEKHVVLELKL